MDGAGAACSSALAMPERPTRDEAAEKDGATSVEEESSGLYSASQDSQRSLQEVATAPAALAAGRVAAAAAAPALAAAAATSAAARTMDANAASVGAEDAKPVAVERLMHVELGGLSFNADFDSGNLARIVQRSEPEAAKRWKEHQLSSSPQPDFRSPSSGTTWRNLANAATQRTPRTPPLFTVWTRADCEGTAHATKSRSWFHFSVRGAPANKVLQFEIIMSNQAKLFSHDMRPVYRSLPSQPEWRPVRSATPWQVT